MLKHNKGIVLEKIEHLQNLSKNIMDEAIQSHSNNVIEDEQFSEICTQSRIYSGQADILKWVLQSLSESSPI